MDERTGQSVTPERPSTPCARCGASIAEGYAFCPACGRSVAADSHSTEPTEHDPARRGTLAARLDVVAGVLLAVVGAVLLVVANQHEPTLENAMKGRNLFTQDTYDTVKTGAWLFLGVGVLSLLSGVTGFSALQSRLALRTPTAARTAGLLVGLFSFLMAVVFGLPLSNAAFNGVLLGLAFWGLTHFFNRDRFPNTDAAERPPRSMRLAERLSSSGDADAEEETP